MRTIVLGSLAVFEESDYWLKGVFRYFGAPLSTMRLKRKLLLTLNDVSMKYWGRDDIEIGRWRQSLRCADCVRTAMPRHLNEFTTKSNCACVSKPVFRRQLADAIAAVTKH